MRSATVKELRKELSLHDKKKVIELCMRLARYKKENKELLTYLLFEAENEAAYIDQLKEEIDRYFDSLNLNSIYLTNKGLRKTLRYMDKVIRYSGNKETEIDLRYHYIRSMVDHEIPVTSFKIYNNIYEGQIKKIEKAIQSVHEDLQFDYREMIDELKSEVESMN